MNYNEALKITLAEQSNICNYDKLCTECEIEARENAHYLSEFSIEQEEELKRQEINDDMYYNELLAADEQHQKLLDKGFSKMFDDLLAK